MDRLLVDLTAGEGGAGQVSVSVWRAGELPGPRVDEPSALVVPLDAPAFEELRFYLEEYLTVPFGVYEDRGRRVEQQLRGWGEQLFAAVLGAGAAHDAWVELRASARAAGRGVEVVFRSPNAELLGLPWELMWEPGLGQPVVLDGVGVSRMLPTGLGESFAVGGRRLRVLMVISRPQGLEDVEFQMVARPLLHRLGAVRGNVDLVVLRPATFDALERVLTEAAAAGEPFQVVHFDGHGVQPGHANRGGGGAPHMFTGAAGEGVLVFERPEGGPDRVPAGDVARALARARVPVVVLNACQSGAVAGPLEATVATRLMSEGAASVVAMAYSVYAVAAAEFMATFYERVFAGDSIGQAVTAGRARIARRAERPSPKGPMPLSDWLVPVHYQRRQVTFPGLHAVRQAGAPSLDRVLDHYRTAATSGEDDGGGALVAAEPFVGRDGLFYTLETALRVPAADEQAPGGAVGMRDPRVVVLHGPGGSGKTEAAKAFGRWWRDTHGVDDPSLVVWQSFEPGVASFGLPAVINGIGLHTFGTEFAQLDQMERQVAVERLLAEHRVLLIWDNFEAVHSMPDPHAATPPLAEADRQQLAEFLIRAGSGWSAVIVTSRTEEEWLGAGPRRVPIPRLSGEEANVYADQILATRPAAGPRRAQRAFGDLMAWLDGHPLSMRLTLPHLETTAPQTLLEGLRETGMLPGTGGNPLNL